MSVLTDVTAAGTARDREDMVAIVTADLVRAKRRRTRVLGSRPGLYTPTFVIDVQHLSWHARADCRGVNVERFFAEGTPTAALRQMCAGCPVRTDCLQYAMADRTIEGFWGGTTTKERQQMRRLPG